MSDVDRKAAVTKVGDYRRPCANFHANCDYFCKSTRVLYSCLFYLITPQKQRKATKRFTIVTEVQKEFAWSAYMRWKLESRVFPRRAIRAPNPDGRWCLPPNRPVVLVLRTILLRKEPEF